MTRSITLATLLALTATMPSPSLAGPHDKILPALVLVVATAQSAENSACVGCRVNAQSTGFYISRRGAVATSYHVIGKLGAIDRNTLKIQVIEGVTQRKFDAEIDNYDTTKDTLTLITNRIDELESYVRSKKSDVDSLKVSTSKIFSSGFPKGYNYLAEQGFIKSFIGPRGHNYLWVTDMEFKEGHSGSPVYTEDGNLLGIVKGSEADFPKNNFIVPAEHISRLRVIEEVGRAPETKSDSGGSIGITQVKTVQDLEKRELIRTFLDRNSHCEKERFVEWRIAATAGWKIDISAVAWKVTTPVVHSAFTGFKQKSDKEIVAGGVIRNFGECVKLGETVLAKDERGELGLEVRYFELKSVDRAVEKEVLKVPYIAPALTPASTSLVIPNVADPSGLKFSFTDKQGSRFEYGINDANPYFSPKFDAANQAVVITNRRGM